MPSINGVHIKPWTGPAVTEALAYVKAKGRANNEPCCICSLPIDYDLNYPDPSSCSVQHIKPRSHYPMLTWDRNNWEAAHLSCNRAAGNRDVVSLGITSDW